MSVRRGRAPVSRGGVLALLAVAEFMLTLDLSIVNVALPSIGRDLGLGRSGLEWVVNGYAVTFGGFLLLGGRAADLLGGRRVFLAALGAFVLASLGCALAGGAGTLVAARVAQGLSAGVLSPATLSLLTQTYAAPPERNRALSIWTAVAIAGGAAGALLGGALVALGSWRLVFFVNVPVGALLAARAAARLPRIAADGGPRSLDLAGAVTVTGGLLALVWALIRAQEDGWGSGPALRGLLGAGVLLGAFAVVESRVARAPLVPFSAFRSRLLAAGNALSLLSFVPVLPTWFLLTLYLQDVRGYTPLRTGLIFVPVSLAVVGGSQVSFRLIARVSARRLFAGGGALAAAGMAWLAQLSPGAGLAWSLIVPGAVVMAGGGLMFAPITVAATSGGAPGQDGLASGLLNTSRQIGGALGLALLASVAAAPSGTAAATAGYGAPFRLGAAIFLVTAVAGALLLPARLTTPDDRRERPAPQSAPLPPDGRASPGRMERREIHPAAKRSPARP
jgi:EmrB/QacA subfamily drug resistance transporter